MKKEKQKTREEEIVFEVGTGDMIRDYELLTSDRFLEIYGDEETLKEMGEWDVKLVVRKWSLVKVMGVCLFYGKVIVIIVI